MGVAASIVLTGCEATPAGPSLRDVVTQPDLIGVEQRPCDEFWAGLPENADRVCGRLPGDIAEEQASQWFASQLREAGVELDDSICTGQHSSAPQCTFFASGAGEAEVLTISYVRDDLLDANGTHRFELIAEPSDLTPERLRELLGESEDSEP